MWLPLAVHTVEECGCQYKVDEWHEEQTEHEVGDGHDDGLLDATPVGVVGLSLVVEHDAGQHQLYHAHGDHHEYVEEERVPATRAAAAHQRRKEHQAPKYHGGCSSERWSGRLVGVEWCGVEWWVGGLVS